MEVLVFAKDADFVLVMGVAVACGLTRGCTRAIFLLLNNLGIIPGGDRVKKGVPF